MKVQLRDLRGATFRANPAYVLVPLTRDTLSRYGSLHTGLREAETVHALLYPRSKPARGIKLISEDTGALFSALRHPGPLPIRIARERRGPIANAIARLVLDGVLEVQLDERYVSGAEAFSSVFAGIDECRLGGTVSRLSIEALKHAQASKIKDSFLLAPVLYRYNQLPLAKWKKQFPDARSVVRSLSLDQGAPVRQLLEKRWHVAVVSRRYRGWVLWKPNRAWRPVHRHVPYFKLYVSPGPRVTADALQIVASVISKSDSVLTFKVCSDLAGLLRPDKIVIYFARLKDLLAFAEALTVELDGCPAHGVPFTAEFSGRGLLSWGVDPPAEDRPIESAERESWRLWISKLLATAIVTAKASRRVAVEPWRFALARLALEGIDTTTWIPRRGLWGGGH